MPAETVFAAVSTSNSVLGSVTNWWQSLNRGWKATLIGLAIVLGFIVVPL
ncbi:hypothetical protein HUG10_16075 [Halorarum halophilum]|uniref:Uncharacterized protein n=1 Tax=Halorarum halophilum TaxID=2743090 RepID=A0A7D5K2N6_9EURY|nr:hypothetical protein [Halobaculum halophilum]QLG28961.1 hypothetical protein HUG10_16075 [Halobaculum halophilum]